MFDIQDAILFSDNVSNINFDTIEENNTNNNNDFLSNLTFGSLLSGVENLDSIMTDPIGSGVGIALSTINNFIPGFSALTSILGQDFSQNISNVLNYGLNSWGATTTPESIQPHLDQFKIDIQNYIKGFETDLEGNFNELSRFLHWGSQFYTRMRENHASANSTKEAYNNAMALFHDKIVNMLYPMFHKFAEKGLATSSPKIYVTANDFLHLGQPVNQNDPQIWYHKYTFDKAKLKALSSEINTDTNTDINNGNITQGNFNPDGTLSDTPNGQGLTSSKSNNAWLIALGLWALTKK